MKILFQLLLIVLTSHVSWSQCPSGQVILGNQEELDQFISDYPNCTELLGDLYIVGSIGDISALNNITKVGGELWLAYLTVLENAEGLENLEYVGGALWIHQNFSLINLQGLSSLRQIDGDLMAFSNFSNFKSFEGLEQLKIIKGGLEVSDNTFTHIGNLPAIDSIGGLQVCAKNLKSLEGLESLSYISNRINFCHTDSLIDLRAIHDVNVEGVTHLSIENNTNLSVCNEKFICKAISHLDEDKVSIKENAPGCNSKTEVEAACIASNTNFQDEVKISIFPNPAQDLLKVVSDDPIAYKVYDTSGRQRMHGITHESHKISINKLEAGLYFIKFENGIVRRVIKI